MLQLFDITGGWAGGKQGARMLGSLRDCKQRLILLAAMLADADLSVK